MANFNIGLILGFFISVCIFLILIITKLQPKPTSPMQDLLPDFRPSQTQRYITSSKFLYDCYEYLMQRLDYFKHEEWILFITGFKTNNDVHLISLYKPKLSSQSAAYVKVDEYSARDILIEIDEYGAQLHAIFHSHRFCGLPAPSPVDVNNHKMHERGRYNLITGIFSEDGYITFWNTGHTDFKVSIIGKGVETLDESGKHFRLSKIG